MPFDPDLRDVQGLVASSYGHLRFAAYVLLEVCDAPLAKRWLTLQNKNVISAAGKENNPGRFLNLAFTWQGLQKLGISDEKGFSKAFREGMTGDHRQRVLGDDAESLGKWRWGTTETLQPHLLVMLFAESEVELEERHAQLVFPESGMTVRRELTTQWLPDGREHFGFADGISQPVVEGFNSQYLHQLALTGTAGVLKPGEFLLGYTNEFGTVSEAPPDIGRNGSYLVFRQMEQDVDGFHQYFAEKAHHDPKLAAYLEAKAIGRWPSGAPLTLAPNEDDPSLRRANDFSYAVDDPDGFSCPVGAHIRRANPRDFLEQNPDDALRRTRRRRLIRRGRSYEDGQERGLHFICLCADIERQYEFVQQTWLNNPAFADLAGEADPLTARGNRRHFSLQQDPVRRRLTGMPAFVTVRGGGYFFLPGLQALETLAKS